MKMLLKIVFVLGVTIVGSVMACDLKGVWAPACKNPKLIEMTDAIKKALLDLHNKNRNDIALGKVEHYDQAANMATMQWDDKLAANAALNVHQCEIKYDTCTNTDEFRYTGQNLLSWRWVQLESPDQLVRMASIWFDEYKFGGKYGWMANIRNYTTIGEGSMWVSHFAKFVCDMATRIGCAASRDSKGTYLACNYSRGPMYGEAVYQSGSPASKCKSGKNDNYPGLCSINEQYDVNTYHPVTKCCVL